MVYRWVQDEGGDRGWSLWVICGKKAQHFSRKLWFSFSGRDGMLSWPVLVKFNCMLDQRSTSVFAVTARRL